MCTVSDFNCNDFKLTRLWEILTYCLNSRSSVDDKIMSIHCVCNFVKQYLLNLMKHIVDEIKRTYFTIMLHEKL